MQAIQITKLGGPETLLLTELARPEPKAGEALVRIKVAGVNYVDTYHRTGLYPVELPFVPGVEAAGVVEAVGEGVTAVKPGDRVAYAGQIGSYAGYAVVPAARLVAIPPELDDQLAAAAMLQALTAYLFSHVTYPVQAGENVLIHAAAGGVGQLLVQFAKLRGARVIGTVSSEKKAEQALAAGADDVIIYTRQNFTQEVRRLTDGEGVAVVYDSVGKDTFEGSLDSLKQRGHMVIYGWSSGQITNFNPAVLNTKGSLYLTTPGVFNFLKDPALTQESAQQVFKAINSGQLKLKIERTYPLSEAAQAHRDLESRATAGKLLLLPE
ncbi:MAG TPA: quinone oxidoreductase [Chloroflexia bacterium]|nr:quinone oxidoreductase [Chloroflexia bacterium]